MKVIEIKDNKRLNSFLASLKHSNFLQSSEWLDFQSIGKEVRKLGLEDDKGGLSAACALVKNEIIAGQAYYYTPRGPVFRESGKDMFILLFEYIKKLGAADKAVFLRFEHELPSGVKDLSVKKTIHIQPERTTVLDLNKSEDQLLSGMHQKTRYNIRLSEKKGVNIREADPSDLEKDFEKFWQIMEDTEARDGFRLHAKRYYKRMLGFGQAQPGNKEALSLRLYVAEYQGNIVSGIIAAFFGDSAVYVHGASANQFRNVMAPYLLQWTTIKKAKQTGYRYYDFNGIDREKWPGVTRFKVNFGGEELACSGTYDLVFKPAWYKFYTAARKARRMAGALIKR